MISVFALGAARIEIGTMRLTPTAAKRFGLLLFLAAERGKHIPRSRVREMLFSELEERNASHSLRELVYRLRRENVAIRSDGAGLMIGADDVRCDWMEEIGAGGIGTDTLKTILNGFLPGFSPEYSEAYTEWLDGFRASAIFGIVKGCLREIDSSKAAGDWTKTELAARACLALDPMNGHATIALAEMLTIGGSATQAANLLDAYSADLSPEARKLAMPVAAVRRRIYETQLASHSPATDFDFTGRAEEMRLLSGALDIARRDAPRAVLLVGEPGIGKSRIATEFALRAAFEGVAVVRTNAHPHDRHRPMGAFADIVPLLLKQRGALGCAPESMGWLKRLLGRRTSQPDQALAFPNDETADAVARAIYDVLESVASETPLLLVIDDAHWVDDVSLRLLRDIVVGAHPNGILVLLTTRQEAPVLSLGPWGQYFVSRRVEPLDIAVSRTMIAKQLRLAGETDETLSAWMADVAAGNPFYADSLVAHFRVTRERFAIPPQLNAVVDQRLAALSADARAVLEAIVALGRHATIPRLEKVLEDFGGALIKHLTELGTGRIIRGDLEVAPSHWLIAESVQRNAVPSSQRLLYRRIAGILERELSVGGDSSELWECAQAWAAAGESDHAAGMIATCAGHALMIGRAREAADLYYRAAEMAHPDKVQDLAKASVQAAVSGLDAPAVLRGVTLLRRGSAGRVHDEFELAESTARLWADCSIERSLDSLSECIESRDASVTHKLQAVRAFLAGCEYGPLVHRAVTIRDRIRPLISQSTTGTDELIRLPASILFHSTFGDACVLSKECQRLVALAVDAKPSYRCVGLLQTAAIGFHKAGRQATALEIWKRALDLCTESGLHFAARNLRMALAGQYLDAGDVSAARLWFDQVPEPDPRSETASTMYSYYATSTEFAIQLDDLSEAHRLSTAASDLIADDVSARIQRYQNLLECLRKHLEGRRMPIPQLIQTLTCYQVPGFEDGDIGDFEISILSMILRDRSRKALARAQVMNYVRNVRRPFLQITATLRQIADTLDHPRPSQLSQWLAADTH